MRYLTALLLLLLLVTLIAPSPVAQAADDPDVVVETGGTAKPPRFGADTDYGPFLTGSLDRDKAISKKNEGATTEQLGPVKSPNNLAAKAICVDLGDGATVAFDTDLLRYAAGWTGGFVDLSNTHLTTGKGSVPFTPAGKIAFLTPALPGAATSDPFTDPRPHPFGPLPKAAAHYVGLYRSGRQVVFAYTVGDVEVMDMPGATKLAGGAVAFTRSLRVGPAKTPISFLLPPDTGLIGPAGGATLSKGSDTAAGMTLTVPPGDSPRLVKVALPLSGSGVGVTAVPPAGDPGALLKGGPALWPQTLTTRGVLGKDDKAYTVDTLTLPFDNPTKSWFRPGGFDFFADGRLAVCLMNGDVWVCSGVDDKLAQLTWRRYAAGLYEPLGLRIVKDQVYVLGRDQITRLHDLNADGEADFYENFNNDRVVASNYHSFAFDLQTDPAGNFYYSAAGHRASPELPGHGTVMRVSPDGSKLEAFAAGFRAANGLGMGPNGELTSGDNQGNWTPSSRINLVKQGGFYGYIPHAAAAGAPPRREMDPPLCWVPMSVDNSSGGQVWSGPNFGPLSNRLFHLSYGKASMMLVFQHEVDGVTQGGVIPLPFRFDSGVMRGRLSPVDGQLYLAGQRGWQTAGNKDGVLARVRYTGKPLYLPLDCRVLHDALELTFSQPLDPETAEDVESYGVEQWNYRWTKDYGSDDYSVRDPQKKGRDPVRVASAKLLPDGRTVRLTVPGLAPVMQLRVQLDVDAKDGRSVQSDLYLTIHKVPGAETPP